METTLNLDQIQKRYEDFEGHIGLKALNKAIDKVIFQGKIKRELPDGSISSRWVNTVWQTKHRELTEMRDRIIDKEFADLKPLLNRS